MSSRILLRRGTAAQWVSANPVLGIGELGIETDTLKIKVGNGSTPWNSITAYANVVPGDLNTTLNGYLETGDLGVTVAELTDGDLYIPENSAIFWNDPAYSYTTTLTATQPTDNRIITFPDATGTVALTSDVTSAVTNLINAAPSALDTLNELAAAINNDSSFSTTVNNLLNGKVSKSGGDTITSSTASTIGLIIKAATSQTANVLEIKDGANNNTLIINSANRLYQGNRAMFGTDISYPASLSLGASASIIGFVIRAAASQTANLTQWQDSAGNVLTRIQNNGSLSWGAGASVLQNTSGTLTVNPTSTSSVSVTVKGAASQTADLQQWQDSAGTVLASVNASGGVSIGKTVSEITSGQLRTSSNTGSNYVDTTANDNVNIGPGITGRRQRGTIDSPTAVQSNDLLYGFFGQGWNSNAAFNGNAAAMRFIASQNLTSTANGAAIVLETTKNDTTVRAERVRITNGGLFLVGSTTETLGSGGLGTQLGIVSGSATTVGAVIRGAASQTANLQQWQNSAGTSLVSITAAGQVNFQGSAYVDIYGQFVTPTTVYANGVQNNTSYWSFNNNGVGAITARSATNIPLTLKGAASQTANIQEWQNSSGTVLSKIDSSGAMYTITAPANTNTTQVATTAYVQTELNAKLDSSGFTYASITIPVYSAIGDLPSAADNHGRWAHVHGEGAMYFAHGGAWYRALSQTDLYVSTNAQGAGYTVVTSDLGKMIEMSGGGTLTITDSASFPVGFTVNILQTGSSQVTIAGDGFTVNATPGLKLRAQWSSATLVKRALNSWVAMGDLSA